MTVYAPRQSPFAAMPAAEARREQAKYRQREHLRAVARTIWSRLDGVSLLPLPTVVIGRTPEPDQAAVYRCDTDVVTISPEYADDLGVLAHELAHASQLKRDGVTSYAADDAKRGHGPGFDHAHRQARVAAGLPVETRMSANPSAPTATGSRRRSVELGSRAWGPAHPNWKGHGAFDCAERGIDCPVHRGPVMEGLRAGFASGTVTR